MPSENTELLNTIKYSIWQTRTDESQPCTKEKSAELIERPILESKTTVNSD